MVILTILFIFDYLDHFCSCFIFKSLVIFKILVTFGRSGHFLVTLAVLVILKNWNFLAILDNFGHFWPFWLFGHFENCGHFWSFWKCWSILVILENLTIFGYFQNFGISGNFDCYRSFGRFQNVLGHSKFWSFWSISKCMSF